MTLTTWHQSGTQWVVELNTGHAIERMSIDIRNVGTLYMSVAEARRLILDLKAVVDQADGAPWVEGRPR